MSELLPLALAGPIGVAALTIVARKPLALGRALLFATAGAELAFAVALIDATADGRTLTARIGGWPAPFAITFAADLFAALMLTVASLMVLVCSAFAVARREDERPFYHALVLVLLAGVVGAFLTADLFNLFVAFEVMLIASYVLITFGGTRAQLRGGTVYITTNLLSSMLFLVATALIYGAVGSVNLAELGLVTENAPAMRIGGGLLLVVFGVKSALVPLHGWMPSAYPFAPPAVAALFSGLLTKVGVYAIYRVYSVVFAGDPAFRRLLLVIASVTMLVGVLGAIGRNDIRSILSFHITSQIGYMIMGLGLFGPLGLAGGIFYVLHHIVVKTSLFLSAGSVETLEGTGSLGQLGGLARRNLILASSFVVAALALAGLPPLSGFFAKLALVRAAFEQTEYTVAAVSILVSFLTLVSMVKIWNEVFWGDAPDATRERPETVERGGAPVWRRASLVAPAAVLAVLAVLVGLGTEGIFVLSERAAAGLLDPTGYIEAVLSP